jgi:hypothetical protein
MIKFWDFLDSYFDERSERRGQEEAQRRMMEKERQLDGMPMTDNGRHPKPYQFEVTLLLNGGAWVLSTPRN